MNKLEQLANEQKQLDNQVWGTFLEELKLIFEENPQVESFSTPAYANYFNDGDSTPWYLHSDMSRMELIDEVENEEDDEDEDDYDDQIYCEVRKYTKVNGEYTYVLPDKYKPLERYVNLLDQVPDRHFEKLCEDGKIIFHRDGSITIGDYRHD